MRYWNLILTKTMLKIYVSYNLFSKLQYHNTLIPQGHSKIVQIHMRHPVETFQVFSIKLDIEPLMHLLKISIFSLNSDIIRLTKIMNNLVKDCKIRTFKVIFQCLKLVESFRKKNSVKNIWLGDQLLLMKFFENFDF